MKATRQTAVWVSALRAAIHEPKSTNTSPTNARKKHHLCKTVKSQLQNQHDASRKLKEYKGTIWHSNTENNVPFLLFHVFSPSQGWAEIRRDLREWEESGWALRWFVSLSSCFNSRAPGVFFPLSVLNYVSVTCLLPSSLFSSSHSSCRCPWYWIFHLFIYSPLWVYLFYCDCWPSSFLPSHSESSSKMAFRCLSCLSITASATHGWHPLYGSRFHFSRVYTSHCNLCLAVPTQHASCHLRLKQALDWTNLYLIKTFLQTSL